MYNIFIYNYSHYCTTFNIVMIVSPCFEVKTFSPSIIYTYILIVVQINKVLFLLKVLFYYKIHFTLYPVKLKRVLVHCSWSQTA